MDAPDRPPLADIREPPPCPPMAMYRPPGSVRAWPVLVTAYRMLETGTLQAGVVTLPESGVVRRWVPAEYIEAVGGQDYAGVPTVLLAPGGSAPEAPGQ